MAITRDSSNNATGPVTARPVLLGGYAAKQCPVRTHNDFAPIVPAPVWEPAADLQADFDAGIAFEEAVFDTLLAAHPAAVLIDLELRKAGAIAQTLAAMRAGAPLILGGWLPDDPVGGRKGKPDILIAVDGGYLPADVKNHQTVKGAKRKSALVSTLTQPTDLCDIPELKATSRYHDDGIQLAHYTKMLQACGFHPGDHRLIGAIVGTSLLDLDGRGAGPVLVWHDLTAPVRDTITTGGERTRKSLLECYEDAHRFRLEVAATATRIVGAPDDPDPLVEPVGQDECLTCPYELWCAAQMGDDDASVAVTRGRLDVHEWKALRRMGRGTVTALSRTDPEDPDFFADYHRRASHHSQDLALKRLTSVVRQARMICAGIEYEPIDTDSIEVPAADIEVDFDIEWDRDNRIYQWGLRIRDGQDDATARYDPVVSFDPLDAAAENRLAEQAAARIASLREQAASEGKTLAIYHWSHVEVSRTRRFPCVAEALEGVTVDLFPWFTATHHVLGTAGIKNVARLFGFTWAVDDPGGRVSQDKIVIARAGGDDAEAAKRWCLLYNASDVEAQAAIRDGVRRRLSSA